MGVAVKVIFDSPTHKLGVFAADGRYYVIDWVAWTRDRGVSEVQVYAVDDNGEPDYLDLMTLIGVDANLGRWAEVFVSEYMEEAEKEGRQ